MFVCVIWKVVYLRHMGHVWWNNPVGGQRVKPLNIQSSNLSEWSDSGMWLSKYDSAKESLNYYKMRQSVEERETSQSCG